MFQYSTSLFYFGSSVVEGEYGDDIYGERERITVVRVFASFDLETGKSLPLTKGWSNSALY